MSFNLWEIYIVCARGRKYISMGLFWVMEILISKSVVMVDIERGIRPGTTTTRPLLGLTDMEDATRPFWAWFPD